MGIIQKTRDNSALMLIVIGGALLAFILTEYLSSNNSSNELDNTVGEFNGIQITDNEFSNEREKLAFLTNGGEPFSATQEFQKGQLTNEAWNSILRDKFLKNEAKELGIKVTSDEEEEMLIGNIETGAQPSAFFVNYLFGGSEYYQKNRNQIAQNTADISKYAFMAVFNRNRELVNRVPLGSSSHWVRDFGIKLREQDKFQRLLSNCFYTTNSLAKDEFLSSNSNKDIEVGFVKYSSVDDESIEPTEKEIKAAFEEIKYQFIEKESSRKLVFASFALKPSNEDKKSVLQDVLSLKKTLNEEDDLKLFIRNETDADERVNFNFYKKGEYPQKIAGIDTILFSLKKGDIYGPYNNQAETKYGISKILDVKKLADSAKFEMALVKIQPVFDKISKGDSTYKYSKNDQPKVQKLYNELVDSLLNVAQSKKITNLSKDLITIDSTYIKNNELEWAQLSVNTLGQDFMDTIVTCRVGDVKKVFIPTEQGGVYAIIKVKRFGVKSIKMQIGTIIKNVYPGDETQEDYISRANQVAFTIKEGKNLNTLSDSLNYTIDSADVKGSTYNLRGLSDSRKIIHWAFNAEFNQPSNIFTTPNAYVVCVVKDEHNDKFKSIDDPYVKSVCESYARKQKQKQNILANFPDLKADNLQSLSEAYEILKVNKESSVNLKKGSSKFSREHEVNGSIAGLSKNKTSQLIEGEDGVYIVKVINEYDAEITEDTSFELEKTQLSRDAARNGNLLVNEYITEKSDLTDNRRILR